MSDELDSPTMQREHGHVVGGTWDDAGAGKTFAGDGPSTGRGSGFGRFGGTAVVDEFTELRWITVQNGSHPFPF